ncbi:MAG TPA: hypothetical protein VNP72_05335, partial [Longimicrobium sp.]|nr:hypothetical protein [Longimicrobium sp.]
MKRYFLIAAAALLPALSACSDTLAVPDSPAVQKAPTSVLDRTTGEPRSLTSMTADREFIMPPGSQPGGGLSAIVMPPGDFCDPSYEICECDPTIQYGCQPCDPTNEEHWCYEPPCTTAATVASVATVRTGDDPNHSLEANGTASYSCGGYLVLTGVGIRMDSNDNIVTLWLKYRRLFANGTWGTTELRKYGTDPN